MCCLVWRRRGPSWNLGYINRCFQVNSEVGYMTFLSTYAGIAVMIASPPILPSAVKLGPTSNIFNHPPVNLAATCLGITTAKQTPRSLFQSPKIFDAPGQEGFGRGRAVLPVRFGLGLIRPCCSGGKGVAISMSSTSDNGVSKFSKCGNSIKRSLLA
ncbi:hypothetical protein B0H65DRAFT_287092 [Neurospora tetraspora]|uniref:Uncharacterized protein n=1 Tax=Neurospora tetraspora TaxID=94610 RepID=A0AAE0J9A0_9PEZI|nr:hypothetical protein B0H65DRAFT_287092 [Neurospora tetraspora]